MCVFCRDSPVLPDIFVFLCRDSPVLPDDCDLCVRHDGGEEAGLPLLLAHPPGRRAQPFTNIHIMAL